jgi:hypothetical protein
MRRPLMRRKTRFPKVVFVMQYLNLPAPEALWNAMSFLSFGLSIVAAVLAIDMYKLSRTGQFGASWRVLITASVIYALLQASHLAAQSVAAFGKFSHIVELIFVLALTYSFYLQRRNFLNTSQLRDKDEYRGPERRSRDERAPHTGVERRASRQRRESETTSTNDSNDALESTDIEWHEPETAKATDLLS